MDGKNVVEEEKPVLLTDDQLIRSTNAYVIYSRPANGQPLWKHKETGKVLTQATVLARIRNAKSNKRGGLEV